MRINKIEMLNPVSADIKRESLTRLEKNSLNPAPNKKERERERKKKERVERVRLFVRNHRRLGEMHSY